MNGILSNAKEIQRVAESEMLLHQRTKRPTGLFWMIFVLVFILLYYLLRSNPNKGVVSFDSNAIHPKLQVGVNEGDIHEEVVENQVGAEVVENVDQAKVEVKPIVDVVNDPKLSVPRDHQAPGNIHIDPNGDIPVANRPKPHASNLRGFANPAPLHREPVGLRDEVREGILDLGHGLNLRKDVNPDYIDAALHNQEGGDVIIPKFNPNKYVENKKIEDYASVRRPDPKSFPVGLSLSPVVSSCQTPLLVILITSTTRETRLRTTIRRTWGKKVNVDQPNKIHGEWKVFFLMGRPETVAENDVIVKEAQMNNDIIQGDFVDLAEEETRKVLMGLTWVVDKLSGVYHCQPQYVLRGETDIYMNVPSIFDWLKAQPKSNVYLGHVIRGNYPNRDVESPYYVPKSDFSGLVLPEYAESPVYLISYDNVKRFLGAVSMVTPIAMDGVYIGMLAKKVGAKAINNEHFVMMKRPSNVCLYKHMFFIFQVNEGEMIHVYNVVERHYKKRACSRTDF